MGSDGSGASFPNGYRFYRIKNGGDAVGTNNRSLELDIFRGSVHLSDNNVITFDAADSSKRVGIVQIAVDFDSGTPKIEWENIPVMTNEYLDDGRYVGNFKAMDVNRQGSVAVDIVAKTPSGERINHQLSGIYLQTDNGSFQPVLTYGQQLADNSVYTTGQLGDIDLHEDNDIMFSSHLKYVDNENMHGYGVLYLPAASLNSSELVMTTGDFVPFSNHAMETFGLIDMHDNGHYAVSGHATALGAATNSNIDEPSSSALLVTGNVATSETLLLGAASDIGGGELTAPCFYGPRTTSTGDVYGITWDETEDHMSLSLGADKIIASGDTTPLGNQALYLSTGTVSHDDSLFYSLSAIDDEGHAVQELLHYNGAQHSVLLATGDTLSDGGAPVETIYFGGTTLQADSQDRIVFYCTFADGTRSLVVGIPA
ncbi:hypothetical protein [Desulfuromusa kysingii]|nr:hypothetical protein [Desulfuromusa kysingii]